MGKLSFDMRCQCDELFGECCGNLIEEPVRVRFVPKYQRSMANAAGTRNGFWRVFWVCEKCAKRIERECADDLDAGWLTIQRPAPDADSLTGQGRC